MLLAELENALSKARIDYQTDSTGKMVCTFKPITFGLFNVKPVHEYFLTLDHDKVEAVHVLWTAGGSPQKKLICQPDPAQVPFRTPLQLAVYIAEQGYLGYWVACFLPTAKQHHVKLEMVELGLRLDDAGEMLIAASHRTDSLAEPIIRRSFKLDSFLPSPAVTAGIGQWIHEQQTERKQYNRMLRQCALMEDLPVGPTSKGAVVILDLPIAYNVATGMFQPSGTIADRAPLEAVWGPSSTWTRDAMVKRYQDNRSKAKSRLKATGPLPMAVDIDLG